MKFTIGTLYKIKFLDHAVGMDNHVECEVVGWLLRECKTSITLSHWRVITSDKELEKDNYEYTTILKSAITGRKKVEP